MHRAPVASFVLSSLVLSSLALTACSSRDTLEPPVAHASSPVIRGSLDSGATHDDVVYIEFVVDPAKGLGGACSGTLIAPNVVVTARHCVSQIDESVYPPTTGADFDTANMGVYLHTNPTGSSTFHTPDAKVKKIVHDGASSLADHDFAMIVLDRSLSTTYSPIRLASAPTPAEKVFVVGYGVTETDTASTPTPHQRYWRDDLSIQAIGPDGSGFLGAHEIALGESICQGDSGGPVKDHATGALLAVTSRGGNGSAPSSSRPWAACVGSSTMNLFTRVDSFASLIKSTLGSLGESPWEEGTTKPPDGTPPPPAGTLGAPCTTNAECTSNLCISVDGSNVCSKACDASRPCPSGFDCVSGYCLATPTTPPPASDAGTTPPDEAGTTPPGFVAPTTTTTESKGGCTLASTTAPATPQTPRSRQVAVALFALGLVTIVRRRRAR